MNTIGIGNPSFNNKAPSEHASTPTKSQNTSKHRHHSKAHTKKKSRSRSRKKGILKSETGRIHKSKKVSISADDHPDEHAESSRDSLPLGAEFYSYAHTSYGSDSHSDIDTHSGYHVSKGSERSSGHYHHHSTKTQVTHQEMDDYGGYNNYAGNSCCNPCFQPMFCLIQPQPPKPEPLIKEKGMMPIRTNAFIAPYTYMPWMSPSQNPNPQNYKSSDSESENDSSTYDDINNCCGNTVMKSGTRNKGDDGNTGFQYIARPDCATEISFTVEPRKQPMWETMLGCGFRPVINCEAPPYMLNPSEPPPKCRYPRRRMCQCRGYRYPPNPYFQGRFQQPPPVDHNSSKSKSKRKKKKKSSKKSSYSEKSKSEYVTPTATATHIKTSLPKSVVTYGSSETETVSYSTISDSIVIPEEQKEDLDISVLKNFFF